MMCMMMMMVIYLKHCQRVLQQNEYIAREYYNPKYCQEIPQTKVLPVNATIIGIPRIIIKTRLAPSADVFTIKRFTRNQNSKYDKEESQSKWTAVSIKIKNTARYLTTEFEMAAREYHSKKTV